MEQLIEERVGAFDVIRRRRETELYKSSLMEFVKKAWPIVEPDRPFVSNWHIEELCRVLEQVTRKELKRVIINIPPGAMKSLLISVFWPAWMWASNPKLRVLTAAYGQHLTTRDNLRVRDIVNSPWYQSHFPITLVADQNTKTRFNTANGGWRIATSVGGVGTGEHPDVILIDDAITADQAQSEPERSAANRWFDRTMSTRGATRDAVILVVGQRLHEDDLPGYLLQRAGWTHVCFPMRYIPTRPKTDSDSGFTADPRDPRRAPGELLWPEMFSEEKVTQLEVDLGAYGAAGQLQQQPAPEGGGLFKREWFRFLDVLPKVVVKRVRGWDTAATEGAGDYTVGVKIFELPDGTYVVADVVRGQLGPADVDTLMQVTAENDGQDCAQREEREGGASGKSVVAARAKLLRGLDYQGVSIGGNKLTRARAFRAQCQAGNVALLRAPWNKEYLDELANYPGKHDDQVDGSSCAFNALMEEAGYVPTTCTW